VNLLPAGAQRSTGDVESPALRLDSDGDSSPDPFEIGDHLLTRCRGWRKWAAILEHNVPLIFRI
jgi:hypothetical protein